MREETGTRLVDWVDHLVMLNDQKLTKWLTDAGFATDTPSPEIGTGATDAVSTWHHAGGLFPRLRLVSEGPEQLAIRVDSVVDFVLAWRSSTQGGSGIMPEGKPMAGVRRATISREAGRELVVIERSGSRSLAAENMTADEADAVLHHSDQFRLRSRNFASGSTVPSNGFVEAARLAFAHTRNLIQAAIDDLGTGRACHLFFEAERRYWQARNRAARVQKARQDSLGLGWGNHDHHTYRSSREHFAALIAILEDLGFECRERFYAGQTAGWGAQVLEQSEAGVIVFADVDLSPEEVCEDFAHEPLPPRDDPGTVGLWCLLHGEAFLEAGMHHLECQFDFDAARDQLRESGIKCMSPFTELPYLQQAFTVGETWPVSQARIDALLTRKLITDERAEVFRSTGAIGSHLEILQRDDGYKGFNQSGIDDIILRTDPRRVV